MQKLTNREEEVMRILWRLENAFVKDVSEHVHLHEQIIVKVLDIDIPRKRIQLKLHK